jgi:hypothetical protein
MPRMNVAVNLLWVLLSLLGALALAHVVGVVNPTEKVNGLWLVVAAACIYVLAYRFYGRWLAKRVIELNNQHVTPAVRLNDGVRYSRGLGKNVKGGAKSYGVNISCKTARTAARVPGVMRPSRLTRRSLSTVRNWSMATNPERSRKRHRTRQGHACPPVVMGATITVRRY